MSLYSDILAKKLCEEHLSKIIEVLLPEPDRSAELVCYEAILKIRTILKNDSLSDQECFQYIDEIVAALEDIGTDSGFRHDFG